jgi:hypothetical protein
MFTSSKLDQMPNTVRADGGKKDAWKQGQEDLGEYFQTQLFLAGLHNIPQCELMKTNKDTWAEVYEATIKFVSPCKITS